jgi:hypothetical protein
MPGPALPADERPVDPTPVHTVDLPPTPVRDRTIPASAWVEAPPEVRRLGDDFGEPIVAYKRRIGRWLLWRAGPARRGRARYVAVDAERLERRFTFDLLPDGTGRGIGPGGTEQTRFRAWKEDLQAHG